MKVGVILKGKNFSWLWIVLAAVLVLGLVTVITNRSDGSDLPLGGGSLLDPLPGNGESESDQPGSESCTHASSTAKVLTKATCEAEGLKQISCKLCGHEEKQVIPKLNHVWGNSSTAVESTCEIVTVCTCQNCGKTEVSGTGYYAHDFVFGFCLNCGEDDPDYVEEDEYPSGGGSDTGNTENEDLCVNGHSYVVISSSEATCTSGGYTTSRCTVCGASVTESVPVIGHSYVTIQTDVDVDGKKHFVKECTKCGDQIIT